MLLKSVGSTGEWWESEYGCVVAVGVSKLSIDPRELLRSVEEYGLGNEAHCMDKSLQRQKYYFTENISKLYEEQVSKI